MLVGLIDGVKVVGTASNGAEAVELVRAERPDVVEVSELPGSERGQRGFGSSGA
jgi:dUTPase